MFWLWTIALNGGLGLAAYGLARWAFRQPAGLPRALAAATLFWAGATIGTLGLGLAGRLERPMLLAFVLVALAVAALARLLGRGAAPPKATAPDDAEDRGGPWDAPATIALGLTLWAAMVVGAPSLLMPPKVVSDGPIYHLYFAARWWQAGRIFLVATPFGENAATYFPAGGEVWFTWLMTCWGGGRLAQVGQAPFLLMAGAAAYGMARRLGAGASASLLATTFFVTTMPLILFSFEGNVDTIFVAGYLTAAYFGLRYALRDGGAGTLALAGLAAGLAWGTKPTAIVFVPPLLAVVAGVILLRGGPGRARLRDLAVLLVTSSLGIASWYGRNAALTGNPLYPLHLQLFGATILQGWYTSDAMRFSQFYIPRGMVSALWDILLMVLDPRLLPFWLAAILGLWRVGRGARPARHAGWVWGFSAMAVLQVALYWVLIPYRTQQRFMLHGLGLWVVPLARLFDRGRWLRWLALGALGAHLVTPHSWPVGRPGEPLPWDLTTAIPDVPLALIKVPLTLDEWRGYRADGWGLGYLIGVLILAPVGVGAAWAWNRVRRGATTRRLVSAMLASATLVFLPIAGLVWGIGALEIEFPNFPDYARAWRQLESRSGPGGVRLAYAGTNIPYYLMGSDLRNEVLYVNIDAHREWLLHDYHRTAADRGEPTVWPTPRPGWDRIRPDYEAWLSNLRASGIQVLVVARAKPEDGPFNVADNLGFPIERTWAESHPEVFEPLYGVAEGDPEMRLYRVRPE